MLFVEGGTNRVGIGQSSPATTVDIGGAVNSDMLTMSSVAGRGLKLGTAVRGSQNDGVGVIDAQDTDSTGGRLELHTAGVDRLRLEAPECVFNELSNDTDFRVESNSNANCLHVDAGNDLVHFGKNTSSLTTTGATISAGGTATFAFNLTSENESFILNNNNATGAVYKMDFRQNNSSKGNIACGSSSTAFNTSSDYRLKENVETLKDGLTRLGQLKPVQFNWITDGELSEGFIAHEVDEVFPCAVSGEKDAVDGEGNIDSQQMDYGRITPLLVKAIQEQQEQIEELKAKIAVLEGGN